MIWEIWSEGFVATGQSGRATKHGEVNAATFDEAVQRLALADPEFARYLSEDRKFYWGCKLFPTYEEAARSFG